MNNNKKGLNFMIFTQHLLAAFIAFVVAYAVAGTSIVISGVNGQYSYNLYESDKGREYEDSYLFNNILGNNVSDVVRLIALRTQLETGGEYDSDKTIDVTAYVNRGTTLPGDYVTAVYYLSDLLKWAQGGFAYETKDFSKEESAEFLSSSTTYTHLKNNIVSGGMNSYLSSQIQGNSLNFSISGNSSPEEGKHTYLLSRYQTIDGKNIEDIVSNWEEYNLLCSYVEEAAKDLLVNYEEYGKALDYYSYDKSNLRYYVTRTIDGKAEVYTNIEGLKGETTGLDIGGIFKEYGRYIYYCPYDLTYETNTKINESVVRSILKTYSYAYPDQIKVYVAVDTKNYSANDAFVEGMDNFSRFMPYKTQLYILCVLFAAVYIFITIFVAGKCKKYAVKKKRPVEGSYLPDELLANENAIKDERGIFTELIVLIGIAILAVPTLAILVLRLLYNSFSSIVRLEAFPYITAGCAVFVSIGILFIIYSLAAKAGTSSLWKDSFLRSLVQGVRNLIINTTDNGNVIIRTWIPYIFFVVMNLLLFKIGIAGIIIAAFLDILVGIYLYRQNLDRDRIIHVIETIQNGDVKAKVNVSELHADNIGLANAVNSIGEGIDKAVNTSMKDEKLKADLITNVSHDIKTPLTSIINYVDLIKREQIDNVKVREYVDILDIKSQKLKQLTEDLVEASKISSGNISITLGRINFVELVNQTIGEFYEKFEKSSLQPIFKSQEQTMYIMADPRHLWRVIENLLNNVCKYALTGTRVYLEMHYEDSSDGRNVIFSIKNISESELNVDAEELTERFIRGDVSRTTEGSGLGLSIAKNLTIAQGGSFDIRLDGDLFKVIIGFKATE